MKHYKKVLTIAGSDSGGGAGVQADLKTFSALGCYGMTVITTLTAQNTTGVTGIHAPPPSFVDEQMEAVLTDIGVDAVKIGMLYSSELIEVVARRLISHGIDKIVLDPVMLATSGDALMREDAIEALKEHLMPIAAVITPNLPEAEVLSGINPLGLDDMEKAARIMAGSHCRSVLVKGGHLKGPSCVDVLYLSSEDRAVVLEEDRIDTRNTHGTGCTLSSAIAAFLAMGDEIEDSVRKARKFIHEAIRAGAEYSLGHGCGPPHHFYNFWE